MTTRIISDLAVVPFNHVSPFLALPAEIRNQIYDYALDWPDMTKLFAKTKEECKAMEHLWSASGRPRLCFFKPRVKTVITPTILLLNRQINNEAADFLCPKSLVLKSPPPYSAQLGRTLDITEFIGKHTLQKAGYVVLEMDLVSHPWLRTVETLLDVWGQKNSLRSLRVRVLRTSTTWSAAQVLVRVR